MDEPHQQHRADPHRRLQRHTYQEGPGFLFLATRGGRPPTARRRRDLHALRCRAGCVRVAREEGIAAALALGVSRASLYRWRERHAAGGLAALLDPPRGPAPVALPDWVERAVILVRLLTYWNAKRLAAEFTRRGIYPLEPNAVSALFVRVRHRATQSGPAARPPLRAGSAQRALAHRHQGPVLPAGPGPATRRSGSSASSMTTRAT